MQITRLHLTNIGRHESFDLEPAAGLTIVRGPNESGKSTIQRGIELALYGATRDIDVDELTRWSPPHAGESGRPGDEGHGGGRASRTPTIPALELEFDEGGVTGRVVRTFPPGGPTAELHFGDEVIGGPSEVDARLADLTGLPSLAFFRSTAAIRQEELDGLARSDTALRERLATAMSAADRRLSSVMRSLEATVRSLDTGVAPGPAPIKAAADEVARRSEELAHGEAELARLARDQGALAAARTSLAEVEAQLESDREQLAASEAAVRLLAEQRDAEERHDRFKRAVALRADIDTKARSHPSSVPLPVLRDAVARLRGHEQSIADLRKELGGEVDLSGVDVTPRLPRWRIFALLAVIFAAAGVAAVAVTQVPWFGVIALAGVLLALLGVRRSRRARRLSHRDQLKEDQIERRLRGRSVLEQQLKDAEQGREAELAGLGMADLPASEQLLADEEAHVAELERLKAEYQSVLGTPPPAEDITLLRDRAAAEAEQRRHALSRMGEIGQDPQRFRDEYAAAVRTDEQARERAAAAAIAAEARVESNVVDSDEVARVAEGLAEAQERLAALDRRRRILSGALDALRQAERATMRKASRFLERRMARDLELITVGRYRKAQVDEDAVTIRVWSDERGDWLDARALSEATIGQIYLAARLGLVRLVTQDRLPPLVLDDPFATFDDERAARALDLVREIAAEHQVLLLTPSDRYDAHADRVVALPAPATAQPTGVGAESL